VGCASLAFGFLRGQSSPSEAWVGRTLSGVGREKRIFFVSAPFAATLGSPELPWIPRLVDYFPTNPGTVVNSFQKKTTQTSLRWRNLQLPPPPSIRPDRHQPQPFDFLVCIILMHLVDSIIFLATSSVRLHVGSKQPRQIFAQSGFLASQSCWRWFCSPDPSVL
jgi:hypothetical protein